MNDSVSRDLLKPKRTSKYISSTSVLNQRLIQAKNGTKRKYETSRNKNIPVGHIETAPENLTESSKFSANDRLKKYRASLSERKNELLKVHQVFKSPIRDNCESNRHKSVNLKHNSILGKRPLNIKENKDSNDEVCIKKVRTTTEDTENSIHSSHKNNSEVHTSEETIPMDWSPIDQNEVVCNIQKFRDKCKENPSLVTNTPSCSTETKRVNILDKSMEKTEVKLYIVVDTNIFISHLSLVKTILTDDHSGCQPIVYVPWMVIQELDYFKDGRRDSSPMLTAAKRAVNFINQNLTNNPTRLKGQTVHEVLSQKESSPSADDNIIFSCLNLKQTDKSVILLSNDTNLRNKALINNIEAAGPKAILTKINEASPGSNANKRKIHEVNLLFANMCTEIIILEMETAYGSILYTLITKPPWDLKQCLTYLKRFWGPVFSFVISQKQCLKRVEDLLEFIQTCEDISSQENMDEFMKLCFTICIYFKNCLNKYQKSVISCIKSMQDILR